MQLGWDNQTAETVPHVRGKCWVCVSLSSFFKHARGERDDAIRGIVAALECCIEEIKRRRFRDPMRFVI